MITDTQKARQREHAWKQAVVDDFLRGDSIADIAVRCACHKLRVERVIRDGLRGLVTMVAQQPDPDTVAAMQSELDAAVGPQEPA